MGALPLRERSVSQNGQPISAAIVRRALNVIARPHVTVFCFTLTVSQCRSIYRQPI